LRLIWRLYASSTLLVLPSASELFFLDKKVNG
jgi:hypothetical protein